MSCGVGRRHGLDPTLLWLWSRPAVTAPIRLLAWELPYATGEALKRQIDKRKGRKVGRKEGRKEERKEFPLWLSGNKSD